MVCSKFRQFLLIVYYQRAQTHTLRSYSLPFASPVAHPVGQLSLSPLHCVLSRVSSAACLPPSICSHGYQRGSGVSSLDADTAPLQPRPFSHDSAAATQLCICFTPAFPSQRDALTRVEVAESAIEACAAPPFPPGCELLGLWRREERDGVLTCLQDHLGLWSSTFGAAASRCCTGGRKDECTPRTITSLGCNIWVPVMCSSCGARRPLCIRSTRMGSLWGDLECRVEVRAGMEGLRCGDSIFRESISSGS